MDEPSNGAHGWEGMDTSEGMLAIDVSDIDDN
jgi:hypothetical protein